MPELQRLHTDHAPAVLAFELTNRAYFSAFISDRGDDAGDFGISPVSIAEIPHLVERSASRLC